MTFIKILDVLIIHIFCMAVFQILGVIVIRMFYIVGIKIQNSLCLVGIHIHWAVNIHIAWAAIVYYHLCVISQCYLVDINSLNVVCSVCRWRICLCSSILGRFMQDYISKTSAPIGTLEVKLNDAALIIFSCSYSKSPYVHPSVRPSGLHQSDVLLLSVQKSTSSITNPALLPWLILEGGAVGSDLTRPDIRTAP